MLTNMGTHALRFPGGSDSDDYHWVYNRQDNDNWIVVNKSGQFHSRDHQPERAGDDHGELWHGHHE